MIVKDFLIPSELESQPDMSALAVVFITMITPVQNVVPRSKNITARQLTDMKRDINLRCVLTVLQ